MKRFLKLFAAFALTVSSLLILLFTIFYLRSNTNYNVLSYDTNSIEYTYVLVATNKNNNNLSSSNTTKANNLHLSNLIDRTNNSNNATYKAVDSLKLEDEYIIVMFICILSIISGVLYLVFSRLASKEVFVTVKNTVKFILLSTSICLMLTVINVSFINNYLAKSQSDNSSYVYNYVLSNNT